MKRQSSAPILSHALDSALQEQLALRKLRRINRNAKLRLVIRGVAHLVAWLWSADLVREVSPNQPPLKRHQWEQPIQRPWSL